MNKKFIPFIISAVVLLAGIVTICIFGLNLGIDFRGGTLLNVDLGANADTQDAIDIIAQCGGKNIQMQSSDNGISVFRFYCDNEAEISDIRAEITLKLNDKFATEEHELEMSYDTVSGQASRELALAAFWTVILATVLMLLYIWRRFELNFALAAVLGLVHDILITISVVAIIRVQLNSTFIAAMLTIVGYTINNTIIIFDRIRENNKKYDVLSYSREFVAKTSVKESIRRTIFSSLTTLFTVGALCILGVTSVKEFTLPIIVGIISSMYSSVFISPMLWEMFATRKKKNQAD